MSTEVLVGDTDITITGYEDGSLTLGSGFIQLSVPSKKNFVQILNAIIKESAIAFPDVHIEVQDKS